MNTYSTKNCSRSDLKQLLNFLDSTDVSYTLDDETIIFDITELSSTNQATIKKLLGNPLQENTMNNKTATATMQTPDGKIKGTVKWNDYWKTFQVTVDGVISGEFDDFDEGVDELKRTGFKNVQINENTVNLKENYERLFGKMIVENKLGQRIKTPVANSLTEKEQLRFSNIQKSFQHQYPNKQLRLREGFVIVDNMIVERMETFFKKNNAQISLTLKQYI
jgi:hypothetical protein